jgi:hypothetical protein
MAARKTRLNLAPYPIHIQHREADPYRQDKAATIISHPPWRTEPIFDAWVHGYPGTISSSTLSRLLLGSLLVDPRDSEPSAVTSVALPSYVRCRTDTECLES